MDSSTLHSLALDRIEKLVGSKLSSATKTQVADFVGNKYCVLLKSSVDDEKEYTNIIIDKLATLITGGSTEQGAWINVADCTFYEPSPMADAKTSKPVSSKVPADMSFTIPDVEDELSLNESF